MRVACLVVALIGCGGGPSVPPVEPKVQIAARTCAVQVGGFLSADIEYDVTLEVGQAFTASIDFGMPPGSDAVPSVSFQCGTWTTTFRNGEERGCEHTRDFEPDTDRVVHSLSVQLPSDPISFSVAVIGSVIEEPLSTVMFANDSESVVCR